jgi:hypothetical protein
MNLEMGKKKKVELNINSNTYRIISITFGSTISSKTMFVRVVESLCSKHLFSNHAAGGTCFNRNKMMLNEGREGVSGFGNIGRRFVQSDYLRHMCFQDLFDFFNRCSSNLFSTRSGFIVADLVIQPSMKRKGNYFYERSERNSADDRAWSGLILLLSCRRQCAMSTRHFR